MDIGDHGVPIPGQGERHFAIYGGVNEFDIRRSRQIGLDRLLHGWVVLSEHNSDDHITGVFMTYDGAEEKPFPLP